MVCTYWMSQRRLSHRRGSSRHFVALTNSSKPTHQFIIATHSPILMAYPLSKIFLLDGDGYTQVRYEETEHYAVTKEFLANPARMLEQLFADDDQDT